MVRASKGTSTYNGLARRHTRVVFPLKIWEIFLDLVEIIFGMHKDPRNEKLRHILGKECKFHEK